VAVVLLRRELDARLGKRPPIGLVMQWHRIDERPVEIEDQAARGHTISTAGKKLMPAYGSVVAVAGADIGDRRKPASSALTSTQSCVLAVGPVARKVTVGALV